MPADCFSLVSWGGFVLREEDGLEEVEEEGMRLTKTSCRDIIRMSMVLPLKNEKACLVCCMH